MSNYPDGVPRNFDSVSSQEVFAENFTNQEVKPYYDQKSKCRLELYNSVIKQKLLPAYTRAFNVFDTEYRSNDPECLDEYCDDFKSNISIDHISDEDYIFEKIDDFIGMLELEEFLFRPCRDEIYQEALEYYSHCRDNYY